MKGAKIAGLFVGLASNNLYYLETAMYAIVATGGKQYRVQEGEKLRIEKLSAEAGDTVELDKVLLVGEGEDVKNWHTLSAKEQKSRRLLLLMAVEIK